MESNVGYSFGAPGLTLKFQAALTQCCDLFGEFNRYIAPAYYHDRCERSVQMRLYSMHKREFVLVFIALFSGLGLVTLIGLAGPTVMLAEQQAVSSFNPPVNSTRMATGPFVLSSPSLSTYSQQLWATARLVKLNKDDESFHVTFQVAVSLEGVTSDRRTVTILHPDRAHNRSRDLRCHERECEDITILHIGFLDFTHYIITVWFYGLESVQNKYPIKDVVFHFRSYNPTFTQVEIWFRFMFLLSTFLVTCWFAHSLRKFTVHDWSIEQKWMSILLPLLLLYNDPVFPMTFLINHWLPGMLDAVFQASLLAALLLFWLCTYHGIRQNERRLITFYLPKFIVVSPMWLCAIILATWKRYNELRDPTYSASIDSNNFEGLKTFLLSVGVVYTIYLVLLMVRAYAELRNMPYFDVRLKFLTVLIVLVVSLTLMIATLRFGSHNLEADVSSTYSSSTQFMATYGLLNFYLYTTAFVYSPSVNALFDSHLKDNPAFSMINDSDEEVIYGSDAEERPLNRERDKEESD